MRLTPTVIYNDSRAATACRVSTTCWINQDMGNNSHSVHSLFGGESFLVSLALGPASLSSNRVRVESQFLDEGFGSLDDETLHVIMDALDGLQAMDRKVGVISHVQEMTF